MKSFAASSCGSSVTVTGLMDVFSTANHSSTDSGVADGTCLSGAKASCGEPFTKSK